MKKFNPSLEKARTAQHVALEANCKLLLAAQSAIEAQTVQCYICNGKGLVFPNHGTYSECCQTCNGLGRVIRDEPDVTFDSMGLCEEIKDKRIAELEAENLALKAANKDLQDWFDVLKVEYDALNADMKCNMLKEFDTDSNTSVCRHRLKYWKHLYFTSVNENNY